MWKNILTSTLFALAGLLMLAPATAQTSQSEATITGPQAFNKLAALSGSWTGPAGMLGSEDEWEETRYELKLSANGTVVMETMSPGTEHEMINMYHLDGEDVVLTHYCAGGNQPKMRLDLAKATPSSLPFDFDGGTNIETSDHHIHSAHIILNDDGSFESRWTAYAKTKKVGEMHAHLSRAE